MTTGHERNELLAHMPSAIKKRLFPMMREVELSQGQEIDAAGQEVVYVYFPADCIVSLLYVTLDGQSAEISVVGNEGICGTPAFLGGDSTPSQAVVQSAGTAYRLPAARLKQEFHNDATLRTLLLRYTQCLIMQMAQTAVCNRHHTIDQQLARWLLLSLDRLPNNELVMTQELIASMLGVRREGVTEAAQKLQKEGVIRYRRGRITVLNRLRLEERTCECYGVVKEETSRLEPYPSW